MFNGVRFDKDNPYTYREGKRLIRLLADELRSRADLQSQLGVDPDAKGRSAITNDRLGVWDFLPFKLAKNEAFTKYPHLTLNVRNTHTMGAMTVPNGVSGGFRTRLKELGSDGFLSIIHEIERNLRPIVQRSKSSQPRMYATQRHYRSQRSTPTVDGELNVDLRACVRANASSIKYQPEWIDAIYNLLTHKRSNIQFGLMMRFDNACPVIRSPAAVDLIADSWKAMRPILDFVLTK